MPAFLSPGKGRDVKKSACTIVVSLYELYGWNEAGVKIRENHRSAQMYGKIACVPGNFLASPKLVAAGEFFGRAQWLEKMFEVILRKSLLKPELSSSSYLMKWQVYANSLQETPSITYNRIYTQWINKKYLSHPAMDRRRGETRHG
jgi:hypothetical protein